MDKPKRRWQVEVNGTVDPSLSSSNRAQASVKARGLQLGGETARVVRA